ncbi:MAG: hypothetical protein ACMXX6_00035 [Candidatus Woesearchaeota archaeon]
MKNKYKKILSKELEGKDITKNEVTTTDYETFKKTFMPKNLNFYENACNFSEKIVPIKPDKKSIPDIEEAIRISHLNISPTGVYSFAVMGAVAIILSFIVLGFIVPTLVTGELAGLFFVYFGLIMAVLLIIPMTKLPFIISNFWRMKSSNQMVLSIFYVVTFMRHTPNLELAIDFAAEHLSPPLSLDFKKVIWDIETSKFDNVTESLDFYLQRWRKWNPEFIESMHLIESSLYETSDTRRRDALDKSLSVILDETFEKMLHFTHDLKGPITTLHMLGIILPILGLVILPLVVAFVPEAQWYHLFALYNLALPIFVYYMGRDILSTRPTGYGGVDASNLSPEVVDNKITVRFSKRDKLELTPLAVSLIVFLFFLFIGFSPLLIHSLSPDFDIAVTDIGILRIEDLDPGDVVYGKLLDYRIDTEGFGNELVGPYGLGASLLSLGIPIAFGLGIGLYNKFKASNLVKIRERTTDLEQEFASALFQLGNRLGDGIPAEIAFGNVSSVMKGTKSGKFFELVSINIIKLGMGVEEAIFDKDVGALKEFPSSIIESSMKVFLEGSRKGPLIASQALITVAEYIKSMHRVDERLKDLMADIVGNMKSQINFLTPVISGIVVGITSMIAQILGALGDRLEEISGTSGGADVAGSGVLDMFGAGGIPTYYFQAIVGLYVIQIAYIMSIIVNGIENGTDKIGEQDILGRNMLKTTLLYCAIAGGFTLVFSIIAANIIAGIAT